MHKQIINSVLFTLLLAASYSVVAHEYWLSPLNYTPAESEPISVDIRNGEDFGGRAYTCVPEKLKSIRLVKRQQTSKISCKKGSFPAIKINGHLDPGHYSLLVETTERRVSYGNWDRFSNFLKSHGQYERLGLYRQKAIPNGRIKEQFFRFAKTSMQIGKVDPDEWTAAKEPLMEFDIMPMSNPMGTDRFLELKLFHSGRTLPNQQIEVFTKRSEGIDRTVYRTDQHGIVTINTDQTGEYLINSVLLLEIDHPDVHWKTLWSSLTFSR